jgi:hypothetical protein
MKFITLTICVAIFAFLAACGGGGAALPVGHDIAQPSNPGTGQVFVRFSRTGADVEEAKNIVAPLLEKALKAAKINIAPAENKAEFLLHGVISLKVQETSRRLGLDKYKYAAQASWQIVRPTGLPVLKRETTSEGSGTGREDAVTATLTALAGRINTEALSRLKSLLMGK